MSQLTAVDISDSDRFELADVLKGRIRIEFGASCPGGYSAGNLRRRFRPDEPAQLLWAAGGIYCATDCDGRVEKRSFRLLELRDRYPVSRSICGILPGLQSLGRIDATLKQRNENEKEKLDILKEIERDLRRKSDR